MANKVRKPQPDRRGACPVVVYNVEIKVAAFARDLDSKLVGTKR